MKYLWIDLETYSPIDLPKTGVYRYAEHPDFLILMAAWSVDGINVQIAIGHEEILKIPGLLDDDVQIVAHNAQFERVCLSQIVYPGDHTKFMRPERFIDTAAIAAQLGWPRSLDPLAKALGAEEKDAAGTRLINIFSKPNRKGERTLPEDRPADWVDFIAYCIQDTHTLIDVHGKLGDWPNELEHQVWIVDQYINDIGILVDTTMVAHAVKADNQNRVEAVNRQIAITGLENPNSTQQLLGWLQENGIAVDNLQKSTVDDLLNPFKYDLVGSQREVLELRQELALTAPKKYTTALQSVCADGRVRGQFKYFGAHTGRWSGSGIQLQNLARVQFNSEAEIEAAILDLKMGLGAESDLLRSLVRSMFQGPFLVADYAAIEARVLAWLAGEQWKLDAFIEGKDLYVEMAARMSTKDRTFLRYDGKVAELACGYQGSIEALRRMGAVGSDEDLKLIVDMYRKANRNIVALWARLQEKFKRGGRASKYLLVEAEGSTRRIILPSGRALTYHGVAMRGDRLSFADPRGYRTDVYGGKLVENVTQAVARDLLAEALIRLRDAGHTVVAHVHDEVVVEAKGCDTVKEICDIISEPTSWSEGLPVTATGFLATRYRKELKDES